MSSISKNSVDPSSNSGLPFNVQSAATSSTHRQETHTQDDRLARFWDEYAKKSQFDPPSGNSSILIDQMIKPLISPSKIVFRDTKWEEAPLVTQLAIYEDAYSNFDNRLNNLKSELGEQYLNNLQEPKRNFHFDEFMSILELNALEAYFQNQGNCYDLIVKLKGLCDRGEQRARKSFAEFLSSLNIYQAKNSSGPTLKWEINIDEIITNVSRRELLRDIYMLMCAEVLMPLFLAQYLF